MKKPNIIVLTGGAGAEREVSLKTGKAIAKTLEKTFSVKIKDLSSEKLLRTSVLRIRLSFLRFTELLEKMVVCKLY